MRKLRIGIIDLVAQAPTRGLYERLMNANLSSLMSQVAAVWAEQEGHQVELVCFTGPENLAEEMSDDLDLVIISAFTQAAQLAYSLGNLFRFRGAVTALGGPHARCYPQDAQKYFDYVLGFTDKKIFQDLLKDCSRHRPIGVHLDAGKHPESLPSVRERWKFIESTLKKAPLIKIIPMIASMGCPYNCSFCIDASVPYQPLNLDEVKKDLRFLLTKMNRPHVGWYDPNFGVRFNECMDAIEEAVPPDSIDFISESSLSLLAEPNLKRLKHNGFKAILPGIESWYELGNKSKTGKKQGMDKVRQTSEHVKMIMSYIPYVQVNFVLGMDDDPNSDSFELTKRFVDLTPGAFPGYSLLSAFGQASRLNLDLQQSGRIIPFPYHFLDNNKAMNVRPKNQNWYKFYDQLVDLTEHSFSWRAIFNRHRAVSAKIPKWMNFVRAVSSEGFGRTRYHSHIRRLLEQDRQLRGFFEQDTVEIPLFYVNRVRRDLGPLWKWLPQGAIEHDPNAYFKASQQFPPTLIHRRRAPEIQGGKNSTFKFQKSVTHPQAPDVSPP